MPAKKTFSALVANVFFDYWVVPYETPTYILTENEVQSTSKMFAALCTMLGVTHLTAIAYPSPTKRQVEQYNREIVSPLWHFDKENQKDWDKYVSSLKYVYYMLAHKSTNNTSLVLRYHSTCLGSRLCCNQVVSRPTAMLRLTSNG